MSNTDERLLGVGVQVGASQLCTVSQDRIVMSTMKGHCGQQSQQLAVQGRDPLQHMAIYEHFIKMVKGEKINHDSCQLMSNKRELQPTFPPAFAASVKPSAETNKLTSINGAESIETGRRIGHTLTRFGNPLLFLAVWKQAPLLTSLPFAFPSLSGEPRDGDLFKGHLNHLSYLRVSSLRWKAQQRNFASGFGFVHFITSQQENRRKKFSLQ